MAEREEVLHYVHLPTGRFPPNIDPEPCRVVVIIDDDVDEDWQGVVSDWIVKLGCLYMMAWGRDCSSWDGSVDYAALKLHKFADIPDEEFVMTTWHDGEPLEEVFCFCKYVAHHPTIDLPKVILIDISSNARGESMLNLYGKATW